MKFKQASDSFNLVFGHAGNDKYDRVDLKQILLLATAVFLMTAPSPSAHDISEMTANFLTTIVAKDVVPDDFGG